MITYHLQPPPAQREGGLEAAIQGLCGALRGAGVTVEMELPEKFQAGSVVHLHGLWQRAWPAAARRCRAEGVPYVVSPHGMLEPWAWRHKWWKKWPYFYAIERGMLRGASALLATAQDEADRIHARVPGPRVEAIPLGLSGDARPNYIGARAQLGWATEEKILLFLSRLHPKKGLELLLEGLSRLSPTWAAHGLRLVVVGDGAPEYVRYLHDFAAARAAKLPPIDWIGPVWGDARWPYFQGADLFCLPTYSENFGLAVLESLQVGTPVLTTSATPWGSQLHPPKGYICEPHIDSVTHALEQFLRLASAPLNERERLSEWAIARFSWKNLINDYLALYSSLL